MNNHTTTTPMTDTNSSEEALQREFDAAAQAAADALSEAGESLQDLPDTHAVDLPVRKVLPPEGPRRAGYTKNHGQKRSKARARMAKTSRARNRR